MYKNYKKFFILFILISALSIVISLVLGNFIVKKINFKRVDIASYNINKWIEYKKEITKQEKYKKPKIIFLSGSNTLFGINTLKIEKELKIPTINLGLHAAYSFIILDKFKDTINQNDIVIMPLEYIYYKEEVSKENLNNDISDYIINYDKKLYDGLNIKNKIYCIKRMYYNMLLPTGKKIKRNKNVNKVLDSYNTNCWNKNGDINCERIKVLEIGKTNYEFSDSDIIAIFQENSYLNKLITYFKEKNIRLYIMPPVTIENSISDKNKEKLHKIWKELGVSVLSTIEENTYPEEYFCDSKYHLTSEAAKIRTNQIIKILKQLNLKM